MKLLYLVLIACIVAFVKAQADDFEIHFFSKPNYKKETGEIYGSLEEGAGAGSPRGNMTVRSFTAPKWLQVTLYEGYYWSGASHVYKGSQKKIKPTTVHSVKYKHL